MKQHALHFMMCGIVLAILLLLPACARQPQPAGVEEITFQSGEFTLVGDLRTPAGTAPFPVILFVHGDGRANRTLFGIYLPIMERMLQAGYAVFSWDKPGSGESTGTISDFQPTQQNAQIVLDAIEVMKAHPDIDPDRIGLWGASMGGYVMSRALLVSDNVAFMICQSCGGMSGDDEFVYLTVSQGYCGGGPGRGRRPAGGPARRARRGTHLRHVRGLPALPGGPGRIGRPRVGDGAPSGRLRGSLAGERSRLRIFLVPNRCDRASPLPGAGHLGRAGHQDRSGPGCACLPGCAGTGGQPELPGRGIPGR